MKYKILLLNFDWKNELCGMSENYAADCFCNFLIVAKVASERSLVIAENMKITQRKV